MADGVTSRGGGAEGCARSLGEEAEGLAPAMALSARMLALIQKIEAADAEHFAGLRESAKQDAETAKKKWATSHRAAKKPTNVSAARRRHRRRVPSPPPPPIV